MPSLPALLPFDPSAGDLPVHTEADVLAQYPERVRRAAAAPVRDAIVVGQTALFGAWQSAAANAAAQSDPVRAEGVYLEEFASEVEVFRQEGEEDEALRGRLFSPPEIVTPTAIKDAVDALLAAVTTARCVLFESVADRWFVSNGSGDWHSFVGDGAHDMTPGYPDRRYALRERCSPLGPRAYDENQGRRFTLLLPNITSAAVDGAYPRTPVDGHDTDRFYVNDGTGDWHGFVFAGGHSADATYFTIVNTVESIRGHGVRWQVVVDGRI